jgi:hypothetical protein
MCVGICCVSLSCIGGALHTEYFLLRAYGATRCLTLYGGGTWVIPLGRQRTFLDTTT